MKIYNKISHTHSKNKVLHWTEIAVINYVQQLNQNSKYICKWRCLVKSETANVKERVKEIERERRHQQETAKQMN